MRGRATQRGAARRRLAASSAPAGSWRRPARSMRNVSRVAVKTIRAMASPISLVPTATALVDWSRCFLPIRQYSGSSTPSARRLSKPSTSCATDAWKGSASPSSGADRRTTAHRPSACRHASSRARAKPTGAHYDACPSRLRPASRALPGVLGEADSAGGAPACPQTQKSRLSAGFTCL